jgi:hypothetical protein
MKQKYRLLAEILAGNPCSVGQPMARLLEYNQTVYSIVARKPEMSMGVLTTARTVRQVVDFFEAKPGQMTKDLDHAFAEGQLQAIYRARLSLVNGGPKELRPLALAPVFRREG